MDNFLTVKEISEKLRVPEANVRNWLSVGKLNGIKFGKVWRISETNFNDFLKRCEEASKPSQNKTIE